MLSQKHAITGRIRLHHSCDTGQFRQCEHRCRTPRTSGSVVSVRRHEYSPVYREWKCYYCGSLWRPSSGLWSPLWRFSIFFGNLYKHTTTDTWLCTNEGQCDPNKPGRCCRWAYSAVKLAWHGWAWPTGVGVLGLILWWSVYMCRPKWIDCLSCSIHSGGF